MTDPMEGAPTDGTRILMKTRTHHFNYSSGEFEISGHRVVEAWHIGGQWREWHGNSVTVSTAILYPVAWCPMPETLIG